MEEERKNKVCTKCKGKKLVSEFSKDSSKKDGFRPSCKLCDSTQKKLNYTKNKHTILSKNKEWALKNPDKVKSIKERYRKSETFSLWKLENADRVRDLRRNWRLKNPQKVSESKKRWNHSQTNKEYQKKYKQKRMQEDSLYKLRENISSLIRNSIVLRGYRKNGTKVECILNCSIETFRDHIEAQFTEGMSWDNYGEWEFDHIIPNSSGKSEEEIFLLNHYTNFQPLWKLDNIRKSNKL